MIVYQKKLEELIPYTKNPRYNEPAVKAVANSIESFGFLVPLVITTDNEIVCGHTRYKAAKKLKLETVPAVVVSELSDEQIKAFRLADNKVSELAEWDNGLLAQELESIVDLNMEDFGFVLKEIEEIDIHDGSIPNTDPDDGYMEQAEPSNVRLGDIYKLGRHRLMCGNSMDVSDISKLFEIDLSALKGIQLNLNASSGTAAGVISKAEKKGKTAYCIELEPRHVDSAIKRWEELTGCKAEKVEKQVKKHEQED